MMRRPLVSRLIQLVLFFIFTQPPPATAEGNVGCAIRVRGTTIQSGIFSGSIGALAASCTSVPGCSFTAFPSVGPCNGHPVDLSQDDLIYYFVDQITNQPIPNCPVEIQLLPHQQTGGHCHTDSQRPVEYPAGTVPKVISGNTGFDGLQFVVHHTWPEEAGGIDVQFYSTDPGCPYYNDHSVKFIHCIGYGFSELGPGAGYTLVGSLTQHPSNHFGTGALIAALGALAVDFSAAFPATPLAYNDMSLPWGGVFDLAFNWRADHCGHRTGVSADIRTSVLNKAQRTKLEALLKKHGFGIYKHADGSHWHCTLRS